MKKLSFPTTEVLNSMLNKDVEVNLSTQGITMQAKGFLRFDPEFSEYFVEQRTSKDEVARFVPACVKDVKLVLNIISIQPR